MAKTDVEKRLEAFDELLKQFDYSARRTAESIFIGAVIDSVPPKDFEYGLARVADYLKRRTANRE